MKVLCPNCCSLMDYHKKEVYMKGKLWQKTILSEDEFFKCSKCTLEYRFDLNLFPRLVNIKFDITIKNLQG